MHILRLEQVGRNSLKDILSTLMELLVYGEKNAFIDAGNWEGDTLTEDLDLSYRAQLKQLEIQIP